MKTVFYPTLLLLLMLTAWHGRAQDQQLYSFSLKGTGELLTYSQGSLLVAAARTGANNMAQCFIVKRLDSGKTLIGAGAKPGLFLKREGSTLTLAPYIDGDISFEWHLSYSGYPYASITSPGTGDVLSWQAGSGFSLQTIGAALANNNDIAGDHYRFEISTVNKHLLIQINMKNTLFYKLLLLLLLFAGALPDLMAQSPGVMQLQQNSFNTYFDTGIDMKTDLLDPGNAGEATLEFWIKSAQPGNQWTLTDLNPDSEHFSLRMAGENQLSLALGAESHTINLNGVVATNLWHHIAMTISQGGQLLELYLNGIKYGHYNLDLSVHREFYFYKQATAELFITEIRGWSKRRSPQDISDNQWRSFITQSPTELTNLKNNEGLEVFYGDDDHQSVSPMAGSGSWITWDGKTSSRGITAAEWSVFITGRPWHRSGQIPIIRSLAWIRSLLPPPKASSRIRYNYSGFTL